MSQTIARSQTQTILEKMVSLPGPGNGFLYMSMTSQVDSRSPRDALKGITDRTVAFRFFDRHVPVSNPRSRSATEDNHSGWFYIDAQVLTLQDVKKRLPEGTRPERDQVIQEMEAKGIERVVLTKNNAIRIFNPEDSIIESPKALARS